MRYGAVSPDVFRRFALIVACSAYVVVLALVWIHVDWLAAVAAAVLGPVGAVLLSLEPAPPDMDDSPSLRAGRQGLSIRDIQARARVHQDGD